MSAAGGVLRARDAGASRGRIRRPASRLLAALAGLALLAALSCARSAGVPAARPSPTAAPHRDTAAAGAPASDSVTVALWRFDETGGTRAADAGPFRLDGTAGLDTRTDFGRFRGARVFARSINSFVRVPYNPALDLPSGLSVEAWINLAAYGSYEDTPIAARWTPLANQRSWMFGIVGRQLKRTTEGVPPQWHRDLLISGLRGRLMFAFVPEDAGTPRTFFSQRAVEPGRWSHVAVTYDGQVVRFFLDGMPDGFYAATGRIRTSEAPLLIGNFFDPRTLSDFGGDLRAGPSADPVPWYALEATLDELRLSNTARTELGQRYLR
ncbi:MAG: LamG domain-containing protein [Candidatus Eisenbacteria bacterium]|nr:LamG domain-containing protein [Candidatus Eisenbacteria bacterium]